jgi:hypothetical protein
MEVCIKLKHILLLNFFFLLLCGLGVYQANEKAGLPVVISASGENLRVTKKLTDNVSLTGGDRILSVDNHSFTSFEELEVLLDGKSIGDTINIIYSRRGIEEYTSLTLIKYYTKIDLIAYSVSGLFFFLIGVIVIIKSPEKRSAQLFHIGAIGAAMIITMTPGSYIALTNIAGFITRFFFYLSFCLTPVIFIHFTLTFPKEKKEKTPLTLKALYVLAFVLSLILTVAFIQGIEYNSTLLIKRYAWIYDSIFRVFLIFCFLTAIIIFTLSYKRTTVLSEKKN